MTKDQWIALGAVGIALLGGMGEYLIDTGKRDQKADGAQQLVVLQNSLSDAQRDLKISQTELEKAKGAAVKADSDATAAAQAVAQRDAIIAKYEKSFKVFDKCAVFEKGINDEKRNIAVGSVSPFTPNTKEDQDKYRANAQINLDRLYANLASANCAVN